MHKRQNTQYLEFIQSFLAVRRANCTLGGKLTPLYNRLQASSFGNSYRADLYFQHRDPWSATTAESTRLEADLVRCSLPYTKYNTSTRSMIIIGTQ
jgi:hypothetical protein